MNPPNSFVSFTKDPDVHSGVPLDLAPSPTSSSKRSSDGKDFVEEVTQERDERRRRIRRRSSTERYGGKYRRR